MCPYTEDVLCDLCGGPGVATVRGATSRWFGGRLYHKDPSVCDYYLQRERRLRAKEAREAKQEVP